jgi:O-antigen/teichoic acid export membrane protein
VALVLATVIGGVLRLGLTALFGLRLLPRLPRPRLDRDSLRELLSFGGSLTLSSLIAPILVHSEKLLMGALVGTAALTYYIVPYRVLSRFSLVSGALSNALFPFLSDLEGQGSHSRMKRTAGRATGLLAWVLLPPFALILVAGDRLLALWMGEDFAVQARGILPFLVVGTYVNLLAQNSVAAIQARGRPGLLAWLYLGELVLYLPLAWGLMVRFGAQGAAAAWCTRVTADTLLVRWIAGRLLPDEPTRPASRPWPTVTALTLVLGGALITAGPVHGLGALTVGFVLAAALSVLAWLVALTARERAAFLRAASAVVRWRTA